MEMILVNINDFIKIKQLFIYRKSR